MSHLQTIFSNISQYSDVQGYAVFFETVKINNEQKSIDKVLQEYCAKFYLIYKDEDQIKLAVTEIDSAVYGSGNNAEKTSQDENLLLSMVADQINSKIRSCLALKIFFKSIYLLEQQASASELINNIITDTATHGPEPLTASLDMITILLTDADVLTITAWFFSNVSKTDINNKFYLVASNSTLVASLKASCHNQKNIIGETCPTKFIYDRLHKINNISNRILYYSFAKNCFDNIDINFADLFQNDFFKTNVTDINFIAYYENESSVSFYNLLEKYKQLENESLIQALFEHSAIFDVEKVQLYLLLRQQSVTNKNIEKLLAQYLQAMPISARCILYFRSMVEQPLKSSYSILCNRNKWLPTEKAYLSSIRGYLYNCSVNAKICHFVVLHGVLLTLTLASLLVSLSLYLFSTIVISKILLFSVPVITSCLVIYNIFDEYKNIMATVNKNDDLEENNSCCECAESLSEFLPSILQLSHNEHSSSSSSVSPYI